jgi:adenosylcobalamin-dependent ribonucleoside-triphosphate reductase
MITPSIQKDSRKLAKGIGEAVGKRTVLRKMDKRRTRYLSPEELNQLDMDPESVEMNMETWAHVASRVAHGNASLEPRLEKQQEEYDKLNYHLARATTLMSGRHLQHGDADQCNRPGEVVTNCSTATSSFLLYYLLLNGSGVGRSYDDSLMVVDWDNMPIVECIISGDHKDYNYHTDVTLEQALHKYSNSWSRYDEMGNLQFNPKANAKVFYFEVPDSREGWAKAIEIIETMAHRGIYANRRLILDFTKVRPEGSAIGGMQGRPSSGPRPMMIAINKMQSIKGAGMPLWKQAMFIDHYLSECVLVGGARRAARIATKIWTDPGAMEFTKIKVTGELWSANNSLAVTKDFWRQDTPYAQDLFKTALSAAYQSGKGEPGFINIDKLTRNEKGRPEFLKNVNIESKRYKLSENAKVLIEQTFTHSSTMLYPMIVNPCGEISLWIGGGYCVIADVVPYHAETLKEAKEAFRVTTRALIRANLMDFMYSDEVKRTNRIGVGMTGIHEFMWKFFKIGFREAILMEKTGDEWNAIDKTTRKRVEDFWNTLNDFNNAVVEEAYAYSKELGVVVPHTMLTIKPAGTTSKLFGLSEGAHLPPMREYLRWVQFKNNDPLVEKYRKKGYQVRDLKQYDGMTIVGFPTIPEICKLKMGDKSVTAPEATPAEQYTYLRLLERYYLHGVDERTGKFRTPSKTRANQVSYTLKYYTDRVTEDELYNLVLENQPTVACCTIMPSGDEAVYEYLPEQPLTKLEFENIMSQIREDEEEIEEDIDKAHVDCSKGGCPVDFNK